MASPKSSVKVVEVYRVSPPPNRSTSAPPSYLPLTFFDILWLRFPPVQRLFFYEIELSSLFFYGSVLPKLKHSLSLTLHHYLPLVGNLIWPENSRKPVIVYHPGDAILLTVAETEGVDFHRLAGVGTFRDAGECDPLIPPLPSLHEQAELVSLQVNLFPGSGFCIGISSHHAVLDGKTSTSFVKSWARICRSLVLQESLPDIDKPFYDRTVVEDKARLEEIYSDAWLNDDGPENRSVRTWEFNLPQDSVQGTFELTRSAIDKLRKSVKMNPAVHSSTFSLACSYTSVCLAKALRKTKGNDHKMTRIAFAVDFRARLKPAVQGGYFGNCVGARAAIVETEALLGEDGVCRALEVISRAVKSLDDDDDILKGLENLVSIIIAGAKSGAIRDNDLQKMKVENNNSAAMVKFSGSPRFEVYSTDFGFGRPRKVEMSSIDRTGAICLSDSKNGDGSIEIGLVLKRKEMENFASEFAKGLEKL